MLPCRDLTDTSVKSLTCEQSPHFYQNHIAGQLSYHRRTSDRYLGELAANNVLVDDKLSIQYKHMSRWQNCAEKLKLNLITLVLIQGTHW
jgi:hypothetical protein